MIIDRQNDALHIIQSIPACMNRPEQESRNKRNMIWGPAALQRDVTRPKRCFEGMQGKEKGGESFATDDS